MQNQNTYCQQETRAIILFGESQTCKSSIIDLLQSYGINVEKNKIEIGTFTKGKSCTQKPEIYIFQSFTGYKLIIIDTKGFHDNLNLETDESIAINIQEFLASYVDVFLEHQINRVNFILTECIENSTSQLDRNLYKLNNMFGIKGFQATMVLFTKYNPQLLELSEYIKQSFEGRVQSVQEDIKNFEKQQGFTFSMKTMNFHTKSRDSNTIPELPKEFFVQQEKQLMENLSQMKSYPVQIFQEYAKYCQERVQQLCKTIDVGIVEYEQQTVSYTPVQKSQTVNIIGGILGKVSNFFGFKNKSFTYTIQEPKTEITTHQKQIRSEEDIKFLFQNDKKYQKEKQEKLNFLFQKYD